MSVIDSNLISFHFISLLQIALDSLFVPGIMYLNLTNQSISILVPVTFGWFNILFPGDEPHLTFPDLRAKSSLIFFLSPASNTRAKIRVETNNAAAMHVRYKITVVVGD
ncbi:hypothetical protein GGR58DRAFT_377539 [Xylaria digitata]|nr:hypothetical protein GGR58DRAFT_377539 [Xylaria digitata]